MSQNDQRPFSIHGTPADQDAYQDRVADLDQGRGATCPTCDATDSHLLRFINSSAYYMCDNCKREFYG